MRIVPTFESLGLYWRPAAGSPPGQAMLRFRESGAPAWRDGHPLWFDDRTHDEQPERSREYRGSIVGLKPGTAYEVEAVAGAETIRATAATWTDAVPIGRHAIVAERSDRPLLIRQSGTPEAYILYAPGPGRTATIDGGGGQPFNVVIDAAYVVLRGMTLRNAGIHAVLLGPNAHHVRIEDNDISGWGRIAGDGFGIDGDAAISNEDPVNGRRDNPGQRAFVIQDNRLHDPRSKSNNWTQFRKVYQSTHPAGPQGITLWETGGNHVIRYNEIFSGGTNWFNDGIGGGENFGFGGAPGSDSDIYGNRISNCWDDAIETEGGNANVRVWGNFIDRAYVHIAASPTALGPLYVFRNVGWRARYSPNHPYGTGLFLKAQSREERGRFWGGGRVYVYNNTLYRSAPREGVEAGVSGVGTPLLNYVGKNNLFDTVQLSQNEDRTPSRDEFDYNLYSFRQTTNPPEKHGEYARPAYQAGPEPFTVSLASGSPGRGTGTAIPNFTHPDLATPDRGAQQAGEPPMQFGVRGTAKAAGTAGLSDR